MTDCRGIIGASCTPRYRKLRRQIGVNTSNLSLYIYDSLTDHDQSVVLKNSLLIFFTIYDDIKPIIPVLTKYILLLMSADTSYLHEERYKHKMSSATLENAVSLQAFWKLKNTVTPNCVSCHMLGYMSSILLIDWLVDWLILKTPDPQVHMIIWWCKRNVKLMF